MAHHYEDDIVRKKTVWDKDSWTPIDELDDIIKRRGSEEVLNKIPISDIEKYLRRKKLDNIDN